MGKGTRFKIYLPAVISAEAAATIPALPASLPRGNGELVFVVDDEESIRSVTRRTLERFGYQVMVAANGAEAVALYARHGDRVDVVLTDMAIPVMDGPATIVALESINPAIRIAGSSGLDVNGSFAKALGAGVEFFVSKPSTAEAMLGVLKQVLTPKR